MPMGGAMIGGAAIGAIGSAVGAGKQADATRYAADQQSQASANSLGFNREVYGTTLSNEQPFIATGQQAVGALGAGLGDGSLTAAYPGGDFHFNGVDLLNDPAYNFDKTQGEQAIQRSAAAQGGLVSGGAMKDLTQYAEGFAGNQFQQSYVNALAAYNQAYSQFETTQANKFDRLSSAAGLGQNAVTQTATSGNAAGATNANINSNTANALSTLATAQGNAGAAATVAGANSIQSGINNYANYLAQKGPSGSSYQQMTPYNPTYPVDPETGL